MTTAAHHPDVAAGGAHVPPQAAPSGGRAERLARRLCRTLACEVPRRPLWQRILYPVAGLVCLAGAVLGSLLPVVPGFVFAIPGIWLLCCSSQTLERKVRRLLRGLLIRWLQRQRRKAQRLPD